MDNVTWNQSRMTKLGLANVSIQEVGDLFEAVVTITSGNATFRAEGIFSSARESFLWAYGVKQSRNDRYAGYQAKDNMLIESKPAKGKTANVLTITESLIESQSSYDCFSLSQASTGGDKVSMSAVKASTLLSEEDKILMASLFAKMKGKA